MKKAFVTGDSAPFQGYADEIGNIILHVAAIGRKAEPISYIKSKIPQLVGKRNFDGHTPSEALQSSLDGKTTRRDTRVVIEMISNSLTGFSQLEIECLAALKGTEAFDLTKL